MIIFISTVSTQEKGKILGLEITIGGSVPSKEEVKKLSLYPIELPRSESSPRRTNNNNPRVVDEYFDHYLPKANEGAVFGYPLDIIVARIDGKLAGYLQYCVEEFEDYDSYVDVVLVDADLTEEDQKTVADKLVAEYIKASNYGEL